MKKYQNAFFNKPLNFFKEHCSKFDDMFTTPGSTFTTTVYAH
jgi:hypothetical protein